MLKHRKKIGNAVDTKLYERLKELSIKTKINQSKLLDEAIENLLEKYNKNNAKK